MGGGQITNRQLFLGTYETTAEARKRRLESSFFLVAALAAFMLGDQPAVLTSWLVWVCAAYTAAWAFIPMSYLRLAGTSVIFALLVWGVIAVGSVADWNLEYVDGGEALDGKVVPAFLGLLSLLAAGVYDLRGLRRMSAGRRAAAGSSQQIV